MRWASIQKRCDRFMEALGRRLANGASLLKEVAMDVKDDV